MNAHYPVFLQVAGRSVLVVGGGGVALQKALALGEAGARVTVVAPKVHPDMENVPGVVRVARRKFKPADLGKGAKAPWVVVAATDDEALNAKVSRLCAARRIWANVVDRPALCSFILPAVVRQGPVVFAVSTGGASPSLAKFLAARVGTAFGPEVGELAKALAELRPKLKEVPLERRKAIVEAALSRVADQNFAPGIVEEMTQDILKSLGEPDHGKP